MVVEEEVDVVSVIVDSDDDEVAEDVILPTLLEPELDADPVPHPVIETLTESGNGTRHSSPATLSKPLSTQPLEKLLQRKRSHSPPAEKPPKRSKSPQVEREKLSKKVVQPSALSVEVVAESVDEVDAGSGSRNPLVKEEMLGIDVIDEKKEQNSVSMIAEEGQLDESGEQGDMDIDVES